MPWSAAQKRTAQAVAHGWHPKGAAKGFGKNLADLILHEDKSKATGKRKPTKRNG